MTAEVWLGFWRWILVKIWKVKFGQDFETEVSVSEAYPWSKGFYYPLGAKETLNFLQQTYYIVALGLSVI